MNGYYHKWSDWKEENVTLLSIFSSLWRPIVSVGFILTIFAVGIIGVFKNSSYTLRIAIGSIFILACLRYRTALLIVWLMSIPVINAFPFLANNNVQTVLTVPTLLSLTNMPIRQAQRGMPALVFMLCYLLWVLPGIGISPIGTGPFLILWITSLNYLALAVLTICLITTKKRLMRLVDVILLGSAFVALFGIYGYITHQYGELDPTTGQFRIISVFGSAPTLALFLSIVFPLAIYTTFTSKGFKRYYSLLLVMILLVAIGLTFTRSAFISVPASIIVMILFLPSRKTKITLFVSIVLLAVLIYLLQTVFNFPLFDRFLNDDITTLNSRTYIWNALLGNFDPLQLFGKGLNASGILVSYMDIGNGLGGVAAQAHNLFLGTLYDNGIIGLILLIAVFIALVSNLLVKMRKATDEHRVLIATALAICFSVLVQSFETSDILVLGVGTYFWIIMALPSAFCWSIPGQRS